MKNPELKIIKHIILLQVDDCVRLVNIFNKIVFNYFEPNEYPLYCECSWTYRNPRDANNWVGYAPIDYLIKNESNIKSKLF